MRNHPKEQPFATSAQEALQTGRTYFAKEERCPSCGQRFYWAHSGNCMGCNAYDDLPDAGQTYIAAITNSKGRVVA